MKGSISTGWIWGLGGVLIVAIIGFLALLIAHTKAMPTGPEPFAWNRTPCAQCGMAVSERGYAAQLQTMGGEVLNFDDPGCLFQYLHKIDPKVHEIYFHHLREDRWIRSDDAAFIKVGPSPMGYNFGAVDAGESGAVPLEEAMQQVNQADP